MAVLLSRAAILAAPVPTREVSMPEWGGTIRIRSFSAKTRMQAFDAINERQALVDAYLTDREKPEGERAGLAKVEPLDNTIISVLFAIVDDDMQPLFTIDDYEAFTELPTPALSRIFQEMRGLETPTIPYEEQKKSSVNRRKGSFSSGSRSR